MSTPIMSFKLAAAAAAAALLAPVANFDLNVPVQLAALDDEPVREVVTAGFGAAKARYAMANALGFGGDAPEIVKDSGILYEGLYVNLDDGDVSMAAATMHVALEATGSGESRQWRSGASGNAGSITPLGQAYRDMDGRECRDYVERIQADGRAESYTHRACRNEAGVWAWIE